MDVLSSTVASAVNCTMDGDNSTSALATPDWLLDKSKPCKLPQGYLDILQSHANSGATALMYVGIVLVIYFLAVCFIGFRHLLTKSQRKLIFTPYYFSKATTGTSTTGTTSGTSSSAHHHGTTSARTDAEACAFAEGLIETEL